MKYRNLVKGYMQVPGVHFTESLSKSAAYTSTRILVGINLYHKEEGWVSNFCDLESEFLNHDMKVEMFIEWSEGIVDLGIITKGFLKYYCILI